MADDIGRWLERFGLSQYAPLFAQNEVDLEVLPELTEQDFKDLNIPLGHRKKLLKAIAELAAAAVPPPTKPTQPAQPRNEAERRQLTVLFCDLVDSTALSARLDPEEMREVIRVYQAACAKAVGRHGGYLAKFMGDGVLVYFGYPQAQGNDAERAAHAGLGIVEAVADLGRDHAELRDIDLAVRIGIDTGLVVVGDIIGEGAAEEKSVVGETPNVAARLQSLAMPNQVVIGPLTRQLLGSKFVYEDLGPKQVKGIAAPVHAWRVLRESEDDGDADIAALASSPLVGRQDEYGLLLRCWEASKKGHGQTVLVKGEPGVGKSRLVAAMREKVAADQHLWLSIRCSAHHANSTLYPVIEHLRRALGWRAEDDDAARLAKLEQALQRQSAPADTAVPLLAELLSLSLPEGRYSALSLSPQERREQTLDTLVGWLVDEAERRPVLQAWEDLHWADPTTLELLSLCVEQSPTVAMMNVLTYRSDFAPPLTMRSHMTTITLNRLERDEVEVLIDQRRGGRPLSPQVIDYIVEKTDGVPLYVEELTKAMLEAYDSHPAGDASRPSAARAPMEVPPTLQELLMARLDRLPTIREIAQIGSILGREFAYEMLEALGAFGETELQSGLDRLVDAELLYQRGRRPRARYIFKHALVQDAAYQSLLKRTRQYYHQQVAELLESRYAEIVRAQPEVVAHHYAQAANHRKAVHYLAIYSEKSAASYAHAEAIAALDTARFHAEQLPDVERAAKVVGLVVRQAQSLHFLGRRQEIVELLSRHSDRLDELDDAVLVAEYHFWLGFAHGWLGHREEAAANLGRSLEEATRANSPAVKGRVQRALATECVYSGRPLVEAVTYARQAIASLEQTDDRFWLGQALFTLSYCCIFAGDFETALQAAARLEAFGDTTGRSRALANAAMLAGLSRAMCGEGEEAVALCEQALQAAPDTFETAFVLACLGRSRWEAGDNSGGVAALEQAVDLADRVRSLQFRAWFRTMLAEAYLLSGELAKSEVVVQEALVASTGSEFQIGIGLSRQVLGRIACAKGDLAEAQRQLAEALEILSSVGAGFELARTHHELALAAREQQQDAAAARHLRLADEAFASLGMTKHSERIRGLAERWGVSLDDPISA